MKRQLSSKKTFGLKVIVPVALILNCGIAFFAIFFGSVEHRPPLGSAILLSPIFFLIPAVACWVARKFKVVSVDDNFLHVSNYVKEISVSLSDIEDITELGWVRSSPVTIHLKTDSAFGRNITFMPKLRGLNPFAAQTIVGELKELAKINL